MGSIPRISDWSAKQKGFPRPVKKEKPDKVTFTILYKQYAHHIGRNKHWLKCNKNVVYHGNILIEYLPGLEMRFFDVIRGSLERKVSAIDMVTPEIT